MLKFCKVVVMILRENNVKCLLLIPHLYLGSYSIVSNAKSMKEVNQQAFTHCYNFFLFYTFEDISLQL